MAHEDFSLYDYNLLAQVWNKILLKTVGIYTSEFCFNSDSSITISSLQLQRSMVLPAWWSNRHSSCKKLSRTPPHNVYHQNNIDFLLSRNCIESGELTANYQRSLGLDSTRRVTCLGSGCLSHHMF